MMPRLRNTRTGIVIRLDDASAATLGREWVDAETPVEVEDTEGPPTDAAEEQAPAEVPEVEAPEGEQTPAAPRRSRRAPKAE